MMHSPRRSNHPTGFPASIVLAAYLSLLSAIPAVAQSGSEPSTSHRRTPLVDAVALVRPSVVNLRGKKTLSAETDSTGARTHAVRQVNGMGTGVIIDPSGYILTNFHVVEDVKHIEVTLADGSTTSGTLIMHDGVTDLALIKIRVPRPLPVIPLGSSTDVMLAETVAALGNAYGYEDTVTRGIISELGRTVQVSDDQIYHNLLQTDAPINPGNSGGPLVNLDGEMIGINVAVRVGAQGIAFAIPVNDAMDVAADFLSEITGERVHHGMVLKTVYTDHQPAAVVESVARSSAAETAGLTAGDVITEAAGKRCRRAVDVHCGLLDKKPGDEIALTIERNGQPQVINIALARPGQSGSATVWRQLGLKVVPVSGGQLRDVHPNYNSGLRVEEVRRGGPAAKQGIRAGDILVAMHGWRTESIENLLYVLALDDVTSGQEIVFYIIRGSEPFFGNLRVADAGNDANH